jgi:transposase-like protein
MKLNCQCSYCSKMTVVTDSSPETRFINMIAVQYKCGHCGYTVIAATTTDLELSAVIAELPEPKASANHVYHVHAKGMNNAANQTFDGLLYMSCQILDGVAYEQARQWVANFGNWVLATTIITSMSYLGERK